MQPLHPFNHASLCLKRLTEIAFAHFAWHFIVGKPWDFNAIIAEKLCLGSTRRFHMYSGSTW